MKSGYSPLKAPPKGLAIPSITAPPLVFKDNHFTVLWRKDYSAIMSIYYSQTDSCFSFSISVNKEADVSEGFEEIRNIKLALEKQLDSKLKYFGEDICHAYSYERMQISHLTVASFVGG